MYDILEPVIERIGAIIAVINIARNKYFLVSFGRIVNMSRIVDVFGDSILKGIQVNPKNLRYHVDNHIDIDAIGQKHSATITNYSRMGCTIRTGYSMIMNKLRKGVICDTVVMDFGGNDCDFDWKSISERPLDKHQPKTPLNIFVETYQKIFDAVRKHNVRPIVTTLPPLAPQKFFNWFCKGLNKDSILKWLGDINAIYRFQEKYSRTVEKIAREARVPVVDLRGAFLKDLHLEHLLCEDGTHPNTDGQKLITSEFLNFSDRVSQLVDDKCTAAAHTV